MTCAPRHRVIDGFDAADASPSRDAFPATAFARWREHGLIYITLRLRVEHAQTIVASSTLNFQGGVGEHDLRKALDILDDTCTRMRRILGDAHPHTIRALKIQDQYRSMRPIGVVRGK